MIQTLTGYQLFWEDRLLWGGHPLICSCWTCFTCHQPRGTKQEREGENYSLCMKLGFLGTFHSRIPLPAPCFKHPEHSWFPVEPSAVQKSRKAQTTFFFSSSHSIEYFGTRGPSPVSLCAPMPGIRMALGFSCRHLPPVVEQGQWVPAAPCETVPPADRSSSSSH